MKPFGRLSSWRRTANRQADGGPLVQLQNGRLAAVERGLESRGSRLEKRAGGQATTQRRQRQTRQTTRAHSTCGGSPTVLPLVEMRYGGGRGAVWPASRGSIDGIGIVLGGLQGRSKQKVRRRIAIIREL